VAGPFDDAADADRDPLELDRDSQTTTLVLRLSADTRVGDDRRLRFARLLLFYLFFEASLVPMFFLIGIWGGERRVYAASSFSSTRPSAVC
jgi:hypothetical protein